MNRVTPEMLKWIKSRHFSLTGVTLSDNVTRWIPSIIQEIYELGCVPRRDLTFGDINATRAAGILLAAQLVGQLPNGDLYISENKGGGMDFVETFKLSDYVDDEVAADPRPVAMA